MCSYWVLVSHFQLRKQAKGPECRAAFGKFLSYKMRVPKVAPEVRLLRARGYAMVLSIDEYLQKVRNHTVGHAKVAPPAPVARESDEDGPNDDPPTALKMAA